jgi:sigma-B regulation protein RsbU (phosphoserine phosphatase)
LAVGERLSALARAGLTGPALQRTIAALTELASEVIGVPVALVSLVEEDRQVFVGSHGLPEPWASRGGTGLSHSFCRLVVQDDAPLVVEDARRSERTADILAVQDLGVIAYAGTPLRDPDGFVLGSVCAIDDKPHAWSATELSLLERFNAVISGLIADRAGMSSDTREQQTVNAQASELTRQLQRGLLPARVNGEPAGRAVSYYQPGSQRLLLGGDFADLFPHPDGELGFVLGDVCGHGPESAAMAIGIRASWAALESRRPPLEELISDMNRIAMREQRGPGGTFTSLVLGRISRRPGRSRALGAGHPWPIDVATGKEIALPPGPVLGVFDAASWTSAPLPGLRDGLLLYTDGLVEGRAAPGSRERWGTDRMRQTLARERQRDHPRAELPLRLIRAATEAHGDELPDDVAILIIS